MPTNKNAFTRYKFLDALLSDRHHYYDIHDLTELCNKELVEAGLAEVTQRCIEKDINYLEYAPFYADIERFRKNGKNCIRYSKQSFSIFSKEMTDEERRLLSEVITTLGKFDGLENFKWFDNYAITTNRDNRKIISFDNNPFYKNSKLLAEIFGVILNRQVIELRYHLFDDDNIRSVILHPYQLKQYNRRWYVLGAPDDNAKVILNFALDRIDKVEPLLEKKYKECSVDLAERFEDIIGVTLFQDRQPEIITLWVSDKQYPYIETKPIHPSQKNIRGEQEATLRTNNPQMDNGHFISIECIRNYELIRELSSFFGDVIVLSPKEIQDEVFEAISAMKEKYLNLRT